MPYSFQNLMYCNSISLCFSLLFSLLEVPLSPTVTSLNLHCNRISRIEALTSGAHLRHLDLSSNRISCIEGLASLTSLRTLNLSCNLIAKVEGESTSLSLQRQRESASGFSPSRYSSFCERAVDLSVVYEPWRHWAADVLLLCLRTWWPCEPHDTQLILQQDKQPHRWVHKANERGALYLFSGVKLKGEKAMAAFTPSIGTWWYWFHCVHVRLALPPRSRLQAEAAQSG